ncbi:MAG: cysteine--tRNA ligase [Alphaproteobacteria bacterium]|nr:cysteine--tRNA ligase [Alphaproteobacteria bacterium]
MKLHVHNTLTKRKEEFVPLDPANVRMYVCGPTVYDFAHIGNARPVVVFDTLYRVLKRLYPGAVTYARNITDIDDKIIARALESKRTIEAITEETTRAYHEDMGALGAVRPDHEPRCTQTVPEMVAMIAKLVASGHAYAAEGHVMFNVPAYADYGRLSGRSRDDQIAGARVEVAPYKKDAADFVLWKPSTPEQPGWDSPWGRGRPGWHIECSAMSEKLFGPTFDIHGGGQDLIFPHHENEIAQSVCAHDGVQFVKYWMHNGFVIVNGEKMSKSLGNFYTVRDLLNKYPGKGEAIRLLLLRTHYRSPLDFTDEGVQQAIQTLDRWYRLLQLSDEKLTPQQVRNDELNASDPAHDVIAALSDDLNTPAAIARIGEHIVDEGYRRCRDEGGRDLRFIAGELRASAGLLGLLQQNPVAWFQGDTAGPSAADIDAAIQARLDARKAKNFAEADRIRDDLKAKGVILEDGPKGTTWKRG